MRLIPYIAALALLTTVSGCGDWFARGNALVSN